ncbi:hypothetical protein NEAUS06_1950 [Nematocida ausubeli]|nr:hypothetical protein NEAUS06_1950 [Nematocida ausubeli]
MAKILFGQRAVKKEKKETQDVVYPHGTHVLGAFYMEREDSIRFKLPNGRLGVVLKRGLENDIEGSNQTLPKKMVKEFKKDIYVELLVQGATDSGYECTIFTQKTLKASSIVTGIIEGEEEVGYTVSLGMPGKTALLKTSKKYSEGELGTFQVTAVTPSTYMLTDELDREIYVGERATISPGIIVRTNITGRPKYVLGDIRPKYTSMHYSYTADGMSIGSMIVESKEELSEDDEQTSIIVFVSEDKTLIHAVPIEEYAQEIHKSLPSPDLVGQVFMGEAEDIRPSGLSTIRLETGLLAVMYEEHYSDIARKGSKPSFEIGERIQVCVYMVNGYSVVVSAKNALIKAPKPELPLKVGSCVVGIVKRVTPVFLVCETFGGACISVGRMSGDEDSDIGAIKYIKVRKLPKEEGMNLRGSAITKEEFLNPKKRKENKENKENSEKENIKKTKEKKKPRTPEELEALRVKEEAIKMKNIQKFKNGDVATGVITHIYKYGAFATIAPHLSARIQIGEISSRFVQDWATLVHVGQRVRIVLFDIDYEAGKVEGSIKKYEVLNTIEAAPAEETQHVLDCTAEDGPLVYNEEEDEETEEESSEEDEDLKMELFNSKDGIEPWKKRMQNMQPEGLLRIYNKAINYLQSLNSKKQICLVYVALLGEVNAPIKPEYLEPLEEGVRRDGSVFLKQSIDTVRSGKNRELYKHLCLRYIKERSESPFGYKELINYANMEKSLDQIRSIPEILAHAEMKQADRKSVDVCYIETLYRLSKVEGRSAIEKQIAGIQNKSKEEWVIKYITLEMGSIEKSADIAYTRNVLHKSVHSTDLAEEAIKSLFKMYLKFEKEYGTKEREEKVLEMAKDYVAKLDK